MRTKTEPMYAERRKAAQEKENENRALTRYENEHDEVSYSPCGAEINPFFYER